MDHVSFRTFKSFIASIIFRSKVKSSVVLVASLYLDRCKSRFDAESFGQLWLKEKVFIVAMALANKVRNAPRLHSYLATQQNGQYIEDRQVNAARWAKLSTIMHAEEIGAAERAFLQMIDWDLSVSVDHFSVDPTSPRSYTHS